MSPLIFSASENAFRRGDVTVTKLTFGQVEATLAAMEKIHPEKRKAFYSRLKQWQKLGFPEGVNVGKGTRAEYGATQLFQLAYMIELQRIGLSPERGIEAVQAAWPVLVSGLIETTVCMAGGADHLHYCALQVDALTGFSEPGVDHAHVYASLFIDKHLGVVSFMGEGENLAEEERVRYLRMRNTLLNQIAGSIVIETDSLLLRLWSAMVEAKIDPLVLSEDFRSLRAVARVVSAERQLANAHSAAEEHSHAPTEDGQDPVDIQGSELAQAMLGYSSFEEVWDDNGEAGHGDIAGSVEGRLSEQSDGK
jgi:hypothetical protein